MRYQLTLDTLKHLDLGKADVSRPGGPRLQSGRVRYPGESFGPSSNDVDVAADEP